MRKLLFMLIAQNRAAYILDRHTMRCIWTRNQTVMINAKLTSLHRLSLETLFMLGVMSFFLSFSLNLSPFELF